MLMEIFFEVVLILFVGTIGIIGNCLLTIMFHKLKSKQLKFHRLMILLSCFDTIYILLNVVVFTIPALSHEYRHFQHPFVASIVIPILQVALTGSVYCTTAISIERYLNVCEPFWTVSHNWSAKIYIIPIVIISFCYNIPKFFELSTGVECNKEDEELLLNGTCNGCNQNVSTLTEGDASFQMNYPNLVLNHTENQEFPAKKAMEHCENLMYFVKLTEIRQNKYYYSIYTIGLNFFIMGFIPFLILIVSATKIHCRLKNYAAERHNANIQNFETNRDQMRTNGSLQNDDNSVNGIHENHQPRRGSLFGGSFTISRRLKTDEIILAKVSILITIVFIVCHSIRWIPNIYELVQRIMNNDIYESWHSWVETVTYISHFLMVLNSSVHFYLYYFARNTIKRQSTKAHQVQLNSLV
jgi:hypothetical protein